MTSGFSVVSYTGDGNSTATIGHGLGVAPSFAIFKNRSASTNWPIYHVGLPDWGGNYGHQSLFLNTTDSVLSILGLWETPNTNTIQISDGQTSGANRPLTNASGNNYVAYFWAQVPGYSSFGSYTGNGSSDGPFVYCGFRPRWVMVKRTDSASAGYDWFIFDTARDTYNVCSLELEANLNSVEDNYSSTSFDSLSNGFKARNIGTGINASGGTYIYCAFAQSPFRYSGAR